ncbi:MAG TPA: DUF983 domain-containing protein [Candidatus Binatus sp.]|jgi:uncharacterized protein (DUF983 family)|nr:DUF983 domain-containing protein [Candidatus Binatus sp.]
MAERAKISALQGILCQLCPRCGTGKIYPTSIFSSLPKMNDECTVCHLWFEREEGYFLGAMIIDYALAMIIATVIGAILWTFTHWSFEKLCVVAILLFLPAVPVVTRLGRVLWIYMDQFIDPQR